MYKIDKRPSFMEDTFISLSTKLGDVKASVNMVKNSVKKYSTVKRFVSQTNRFIRINDTQIAGNSISTRNILRKLALLDFNSPFYE